MNKSLKKYKIIIAIELIIIIIPIIIFVANITIENRHYDYVATQPDPLAVVQTFNNRFEGYYGNKSASDVRSLISQVTANNGQSLKYQIRVTSTGFTNDTGNVENLTTGLGVIAQAANSQKRYLITIEDLQPEGSRDGFYDTITIVEQP